MLGRDLEALIQRARDYKKELGDSFVSVEHLVLGFAQDQRFGRQLFKDFQISQQALKSAIESIRGRQSVIDQGSLTCSICILFIIIQWPTFLSFLFGWRIFCLLLCSIKDPSTYCEQVVSVCPGIFMTFRSWTSYIYVFQVLL